MFHVNMKSLHAEALWGSLQMHEHTSTAACMLCRKDSNLQRRHSHPGNMPTLMHEGGSPSAPRSLIDMPLNIADAAPVVAAHELLDTLPPKPFTLATAASEPMHEEVPTYTPPVDLQPPPSPRRLDSSQLHQGNDFFGCRDLPCDMDAPDMHDFHTSAVHHRASCGPELLRSAAGGHVSCPPEGLPDWGYGEGGPMGTRRVSEPAGFIDSIAISGQKRRSDGFGVYTGFCSDLVHQAVEFIDSSFDFHNIDPSLSGDPFMHPPPKSPRLSPQLSPRASYDPGEAFAQHMHGYMHDETNSMTVSGAGHDACSSPRGTTPRLFQDSLLSYGGVTTTNPEVPETSAKLSGHDASMEGLWQMLASEPTLMTQRIVSQAHLEPRPISEMERSELERGGNEAVSQSIHLSVSSAAPAPLHSTGVHTSSLY